MRNERIVVLKGAERVRKRPAVVFDSDGVDGALNAVKILLDMLAEEAFLGCCKRIDLTVQQDGAVRIQGSDRGLIIDETVVEGNPVWHYDFCELGMVPDPAEEYDFALGLGKKHSAFFGETAKAPAYYSDTEHGFYLGAVQYVAAYMQVCTVRDGVKKTLSFRKGACVGDITVEATDTPSGTCFVFQPDAEVFTDINIPLSAYETLLEAKAITVGGTTFTLTDEKSGYRQSFYFANGAADYANGFAAVPCFEKAIEAKGKERYNRPEYAAYVRVLFGFAKEQSQVRCFHNGVELACGGRHFDAVKEKIAARIGWRLLSEERKATCAFEDIADRVVLIVETYSTQTNFETARKNAITNTMIRDMASDLIDDDFTYYLKGLHDCVKALFA